MLVVVYLLYDLKDFLTSLNIFSSLPLQAEEAALKQHEVFSIDIPMLIFFFSRHAFSLFL
jgi:hypothetical protein